MISLKYLRIALSLLAAVIERTSGAGCDLSHRNRRRHMRGR
jgi:hypothetical protein